MGLFSFFKRADRRPPVDERPQAVRSEVDLLRTRARRRLAGAVVLVLVAVLGFPLLFETQPRPLRADLPVQLVPREAAVVPARAAEPASAPVRSEPVADKREEPAPAASAVVIAAASSPAASASAAAVEPAPVQASPETKESPPKPSAAARFVVQVGAFAEADAAREVRSRVEKLGLRTYTQEVDTGSGRRIRVRIGPFAERDQADRAVAKLKAAGLSAAVLTL